MGQSQSAHRPQVDHAKVNDFISCVQGDDVKGLRRVLESCVGEGSGRDRNAFQAWDAHDHHHHHHHNHHHHHHHHLHQHPHAQHAPNDLIFPPVDAICVEHPSCEITLEEAGSLPFAKFLRVAKHSREPSGWTSLPPATALSFAIHHGYREVARQLLDAGANPNACNCDGTTPLMLAIKHHEGDVIRALISHGADIDARNSMGETALILAVEESAKAGNMELVEEMVRGGADIHLPGPENRTALMIAAQYGDVALARRLIDVVSLGAGVNLEQFARTSSYLNLSEMDGTSSTPHGTVDVNARDDEGRTALMYAVVMELADKVEDNARRERAGHGTRALQLARLLLSHGADVNARDNHGHSVLKRARLILRNVKGRGRLERVAAELVDLLIAYGADVHADDIADEEEAEGKERVLDSRKQGSVPDLLPAGKWEGGGEGDAMDGVVVIGDGRVSEEDKLIAAVALEAGDFVRFIAGRFAGDLDVRRMLWRCHGVPHVDTLCVNPKCRLMLDPLDSTKSTITTTANTSSSNGSGGIAAGHPAAVVHHSCYDATMCSTGTLLMHAAHAKKGNTVRHLLDAGSNPNACDESGVTALMHAVERSFHVPLMRHFHVAQELIRGGADVNARRFYDGKTALMLVVHDRGVRNAGGAAGAAAAGGAGAGAVAGAPAGAGSPGAAGGVPGGAADAGAAADASSDAVVLVELLLAHGADINVVDKYGHTPLTLAVRISDEASIEAMLNCAPKPVTVENLKRALKVASAAGLPHIEETLEAALAAAQVAQDATERDGVCPLVASIRNAGVISLDTSENTSASLISSQKKKKRSSQSGSPGDSALSVSLGGLQGGGGGVASVPAAKVQLQALPLEVLNHIFSKFSHPRMPDLVRLTLVCKSLDESVPHLPVAPTHLLLSKESEPLLDAFFSTLPKDVIEATEGGRWLRGLSIMPLRSRDGRYSLKVDRGTDQLRLHVSAAACFSVEGEGNSWAYEMNALGSLFSRCIILCHDHWRALRGDVLPPFDIPPGRYAVGWRVRRRKTIRDRERHKQFPRCVIEQHAIPEQEKAGEQHQHHQQQQQPKPKPSKPMLVAVPVGGSEEWQEVTVCSIIVGPCVNAKRVKSEGLGRSGLKRNASWKRVGNLQATVLLEEHCSSTGEEEENLEVDSVFFTLLDP